MQPFYFAGSISGATAQADHWAQAGMIAFSAANGSTYFTDFVGQVTATTSWNSGKPLKIAIALSDNPYYGSCESTNENGDYYGSSATLDIYKSAGSATYVYFHELLYGGGICSVHYSGWFKYATQSEYYVGNVTIF